MYCTAPKPSSTHEYKGCTISLLVSQATDGTWICRYVFIEFSPLESVYISRYPDRTFPTQHEAAATALRKVHRLIDADPSSLVPYEARRIK